MAWLRRLHRRVRLAMLRIHYAQIKCACDAAALDPHPSSDQRLVDLICRGIEVRERIHQLEAAGR